MNKATVTIEALQEQLEKARLAVAAAENAYKECYSPDTIKGFFRDARRELGDLGTLLKAGEGEAL